MRLAIITTHPVQYYAPWFRNIATNAALTLKVFYLWDFGVAENHDPDFRQSFQWDIPLLEGYESEFVPNVSAHPGTDHFRGIDNPELRDRITRWKPDAVLLIGYNYASLLRFILTWNSRKAPLLFRGDSHRLAGGANSFRKTIKSILLRLLYSRFSAILPVGQANADYFRSFGVPKKKMFLTPHAVDNERFFSVAKQTNPNQCRTEWKIPEGCTIFLFVGKLEQKKRPQDLLEAFAKCIQKNIALIFVGSGEMESDLRNQASTLSKSVRFLGFQNQSAMPAIYASCDVLVLPSYGQYETWGLAVNEAMACGCIAIVSSHVGCAADLVIPGKTGWQFPAGDVNALSACMNEAASNSERRALYTRQAQELVLKNYGYQNATEGLSRALQSLSSR